MQDTVAEKNKMSDLIKKCQSGDVATREKLLKENSELVWTVVDRFLWCGIDAEELYHLGCIGFWKAVDRFNPQSGIRFSTCAVPQIAGEIRKYLRASTLPKVESLEEKHKNSSTNT